MLRKELAKRGNDQNLSNKNPSERNHESSNNNKKENSDSNDKFAFSHISDAKELESDEANQKNLQSNLFFIISLFFPWFDYG
jgi:hypothetical protein